MAEEQKLLLIVVHPNGLIVRDTPRSQTDGGIRRRAEAPGNQLAAYSIHNIGGVPYARLVPRNPAQPEWVRVAEADGLIRYVDVIPLDGSKNELADAIRYLGDCLVKAFGQ